MEDSNKVIFLDQDNLKASKEIIEVGNERIIKDLFIYI